MANRRGELKPERGAFPLHAGEPDSSIMQLYRPIRHRETDSRAFGFGREVKLEYFIAQLRRNPGAGIGHFHRHGSFRPIHPYPQIAAAFHCFHGVRQQIENGLFQHIRIRAQMRGLGRSFQL
jgi:hypothetical protein